MELNNDYKPKVIQSVKELMAEGPEIQLDLSDDAWSYGAPPPAGVYEFKWFLAKDGITVGHTDIKDPRTMYLRIGCEGHLVNSADWDDTVAYTYLDSRVFRGKGNSTMAGFLQKAGAQKYIEKLMAEHKLNAKSLGSLVEQVLKKEPVIRAEVDWRGSYSYTPDTGEKAGQTVWVNVYNHYADFPNNNEKPGTKLHIVTVSGKDKLPKEIRAQLQVVRLFGKGEALPKPKLVSQPRGSEKVQEVELEEVKPVVTTPTIAKQPVTSNDDDASMELMLAEM